MLTCVCKPRLSERYHLRISGAEIRQPAVLAPVMEGGQPGPGQGYPQPERGDDEAQPDYGEGLDPPRYLLERYGERAPEKGGRQGEKKSVQGVRHAHEKASSYCEGRGIGIYESPADRKQCFCLGGALPRHLRPFPHRMGTSQGRLQIQIENGGGPDFSGGDVA